MGVASDPPNKRDDAAVTADSELVTPTVPPMPIGGIADAEPPPEGEASVAQVGPPSQGEGILDVVVVPVAHSEHEEFAPPPVVLVEAPDSVPDNSTSTIEGAPSDVVEPMVTPASTASLSAAEEVAVAEVRVPTVASAGGGDLEEFILPSVILAPPQLVEGTVLGPEGVVRIDRFIETRGRLNRYSALVRQGEGAAVVAELREAPAEYPELRRESEVLADVRYAMLPRMLAAFEQDGRRYLAVERREERGMLAEALEAGVDTAQAISIVLQLTQVLRRLHTGGWALLGLQPSHIVLGAPLQITRLGTASRIGQAVEGSLNVAGYSAPEVAHQAIVTGKEDVYTLGALLYRVLVGAPVPEQGPELAALGALVRLPGAPQLLDVALAPVEDRADLDTFYQRLLIFKEQWARQVLALEVAGGTTIGLNRSRPVNEDAHAAISWSMAVHERVAFRALLCVVDGMGGMEAGEVASRAAVRAALDSVGGNFGHDAPPPDAVALVRAAARAVYDAAQGRAVGATITCAIVDDGVVTLGHVGDTRAYLLRDGVLAQLTHDHSLVAAMVSSGVLTAEQARGHPDSNKVLRSLGGQRELEDTHIDTLAATLDEGSLQLREGDRLLLCSDGVWGVLDDNALREVLLDAVSCAASVQIILRRVLDGGAPDNATLIVARCISMPVS